MNSGELAVLDAAVSYAVENKTESAPALSTSDLEDAINTGGRVLQTGMDLQTLGKDALELYKNVKSGDWEAAARSSIKTMEDLLASRALKELGKEIVNRLSKLASSKQNEALSLPGVELNYDSEFGPEPSWT